MKDLQLQIQTLQIKVNKYENQPSNQQYEQKLIQHDLEIKTKTLQINELNDQLNEERKKNAELTKRLENILQKVQQMMKISEKHEQEIPQNKLFTTRTNHRTSSNNIFVNPTLTPTIPRLKINNQNI